MTIVLVIGLAWTNVCSLVVAWRLYARLCEYERRIHQLARHSRAETERQRLRLVNGTTRT